LIANLPLNVLIYATHTTVLNITPHNWRYNVTDTDKTVTPLKLQ